MLSWIPVIAMLMGAVPHAQHDINLMVAYRQPADVFEILDNVSEWWPGYTEPAYRKYWADSLGISSTDSVFFAEYRAVRERYFDRSGQQNEDPRSSRAGLFTDSHMLIADPVALAFYSSETMEEAFDRLEHVVSASDLELLRAYFAHFSPRVERLTADTHRRVAASLSRTREVLADSAVASYIRSIGRFFGLTDDVTFTALYVWWPDAEQISANPNGPFLVLRIRPYPDEAISSADVVVHEAVHVLSALQSDMQKRSVSDEVLQECAGSEKVVRRLGVIEEPLATIFGNIEFRRRFEPNRFSWSREWYGDRWVDLSARLLYPMVIQAVEDGISMGSPAMTEELAAQCRILLNALRSADR